MKKIFFRNYKIMAALLLMVGLTSACKQLIEVPANPPTQIPGSVQFSDSATIMTAVAGVYSYTSPGLGFTYNDANLTLCTGLSSDEIASTNAGNTDYQEFYTYSLTALNNNIITLWQYPYTGLYPVNAILAGITGNKAISDAFRTQLTGELKVVRAFYYFNLVNLFGGVPLVTSTDYTITSRLPRMSVDSVYGQIITDLTDAQKVLTADNPSSGRVRPNLYTALTLLAKVQLYRQNWQAAYDAAGTVISSGVYNLETDLNNVFQDGSKEAIWQIPAIGTYGVTEEAIKFVPYTGTVPTYLLTPALMNAFEANDQRFQKWVGYTTVNNGSGNQIYYYPYKYKDLTPSGATEDYMILRLGELYLIRAEAAAHLGNLSVALTDINQIRSRAGLPASTAATGDEVLAAIMHERQTELFTEWGNRWYDLKRTGTAGTILSAEKSGWQPRDTLYPVPRAQLQINNLLTQNPGYN
jgi:hypothetical protein